MTTNRQAEIQDDEQGRNHGIVRQKRPNVFIAVELDDPHIQDAIQEVQDAFVEYDPGLRKHCVSVKKCHVTVLVTSVREEEMEKARTIIEKTVRERIVNDLTENQFNLEMKGVDSFHDRVVYAGVEEGKLQLTMLNEALLEEFEGGGFECDSKFTPHVTLMKVDICVLRSEERNNVLFCRFEERRKFRRIPTKNSKIVILAVRLSRESNSCPCTRNRQRRVSTTARVNTCSKMSLTEVNR